MITIDGVYRFKPDPALFETYVQNFDDNYHEEKRELSEFERRIMKIRSRYRDLDKYLEAEALYEEWENQFKKTYPKKIRKLLLESDALDIIPKKPKYKPRSYERDLKKLYNRGIVVSGGSYEFDDDAVEDYIDYYENTEGRDTKKADYIVDKSEDKDFVKIVNHELDKMEKDRGYKTKKSKQKDDKLDDFDLIETMLTISGGLKIDKKKSHKKKKKKKKDKHVGISIKRYRTDEYLKDIDKYDALESNRVVSTYYGNLMSSREIEAAKFYESLIGSGHNPYRLMKQSKINKATTKLLAKEQKKKEKASKSSFLSIDNIDGGEGGYDEFVEYISQQYYDGGLNL